MRFARGEGAGDEMREMRTEAVFSKSVDKMASYQRAKSFVLNFDREQTFEPTYLDGRARRQWSIPHWGLLIRCSSIFQKSSSSVFQKNSSSLFGKSWSRLHNKRVTHFSVALFFGHFPKIDAVKSFLVLGRTGGCVRESSWPLNRPIGMGQIPERCTVNWWMALRFVGIIISFWKMMIKAR